MEHIIINMKWNKAALNAYLSFMFTLQLEEDETALSVAHERTRRLGTLPADETQPDQPLSEALKDYRAIKMEYLALLVQMNQLVYVEVNGASHLIHFANLEKFVEPFEQDSFTWWPTNFKTFEEAELWKNEQIRSFYLTDEQFKSISGELDSDTTTAA